MTDPEPRPIRDGTPEQQAAYWSMVDRVVAQAKPLTDDQLGRLSRIWQSGRTRRYAA